jgi:hypothetical protein
MAAVYSLEGAGEVREVFIQPRVSCGAETTAAIFGCLESTRNRTASDDARLRQEVPDPCAHLLF